MNCIEVLGIERDVILRKCVEELKSFRSKTQQELEIISQNGGSGVSYVDVEDRVEQEYNHNVERDSVSPPNMLRFHRKSKSISIINSNFGKSKENTMTLIKGNSKDTSSYMNQINNFKEEFNDPRNKFDPYF